MCTDHHWCSESSSLNPCIKWIFLGNYYRDKISAVVGLARMECTDMMKIPKLFAVFFASGIFWFVEDCIVFLFLWSSPISYTAYLQSSYCMNKSWSVWWRLLYAMFPNVLLQFWINCELIHSIVLFWQLVNIAFTVATIDKVSDAIAADDDDDYICKCMYIYCFSNKGVQVELGIPYELWDKPSAEVSKMHRAVSHQHSALSSKLVNVVCSLQLIHFQNVNKCWLIWVDIFYATVLHVAVLMVLTACFVSTWWTW